MTATRAGSWPEHRLNPFSGDYRDVMPWNYHRLLTMRENPLGSPEEWLDPRHAHLDISMRDWMLSIGINEEAIRMGYGINATFGKNAADVSALLMLFRGAFSKDQRSRAPSDSLGFTVEDGVDRLPRAMADALKADIELSAPVASIDCSTDGVDVQTADGRRFKAGRAIAAIPFSVLRTIKISPAVPAMQSEAIANLGSQSITQFYIGVEGAFWEEDGLPPSMFTDSLPGMVAAVRSSEDPNVVTHLTAWVIGPNADRMDRLGESEAMQTVAAAIESIRPAARGCLKPIARQSWGADRFARGAWAYFKPGQVTAFARSMADPHGRLHFAGEHLARASRGMEAALETAETAVEQVLAAGT